jgi:hypothetical protein
MTEARRPLTEGELMVLRLIQETWGAQNSEADVVFMDEGPAQGAWVFVRPEDGPGSGAINLTNTSAWYKGGTYSHEDLLRVVRRSGRGE